MTLIHVDREALLNFIKVMQVTTEKISDLRKNTAPVYVGDQAGNGVQRGGIEVTIGTVDYPHAGKTAGELLADRIADSMNFVISMEEGSRALGTIAEQILRQLSAQDEIAAADLYQIMGDIEPQVAEQFGVPVDASITKSFDSFSTSPTDTGSE